MYSVRRQSLLAGQLPTDGSVPPSPRTPLSAATRKSFSLTQALGTPRSNGSLASLKTIDLPGGAGAQQLLSPAPAPNAVQPRRNLVLNLILVRHAETDLNVRRPRVVQSNIDNPLNQKGLQQAMLLAYRLRHEKIDYIYSSPLTRCRQTAEEIARFHDKAVLYDDRLNEQNLGDLTGLSWLDAKRRLKALDRTFDEYLSDPTHKAETDDDLKERIISVYIDVVEKHVLEPNRIHYARPATSQSNLLVDSYGPATPVTAIPPPQVVPGRLPTKECTVVLVTHGGPIKHLLAHLVEELGFSTNARPAPGQGVHHADHVARRNKHRSTPPPSKPAPELASHRRRVSTSGASEPPAPRLTQFPKNTGLYAARLARHYDPSTDEYDWGGRVERFNCVAHLAGSSWLVVAPKGTPHGVVEKVPLVAKVTMAAASGPTGGKVPAAVPKEGEGAAGALTLVKYKREKRDLKKERAAAAAEKAAGPVGAGKARAPGSSSGPGTGGGARGMMRMLGKMFTGGDAPTASAAPGAPGGTAGTGAPTGEEKRNKSLGW
ncbi:hypothetical protein AMAG_14788 [Allomyces macrogynus ATCC 38327]|uniref:Phosphoglycerate mutase n=1 Tax=Allomyces macrogynus (strain ATCC 38327) TaxID=578462 RepID=A0A0L0T5C5_ALLM3|nr:hypothetical protein AMAG_14788 [Allomyces macrogynus ATCC 38327]|eukprot:KNE69947.1 hypothetical protein AMAG_14788 [Allomyces macrogynus ATCC 38327]